MRDEAMPGWDWFPSGEHGSADPEPERTTIPEPAAAFLRCFRGSDGEAVIAHLRALTMERALGPDASDARLRHLEGQRQLVSYIIAMIERGRSATPAAARHAYRDF